MPSAKKRSEKGWNFEENDSVLYLKEFFYFMVYVHLAHFLLTATNQMRLR